VTTDYKSSVFLPKTDFPMRAGLPKKEPELLKRWADMNLFQRLRAESKGRPKFVLHDGPPYANGHLHIGHALNKILKDLVSRTQQMLGKDSHYVPGWDCHGLPIEWKIEEEYRAKKQDKDQVPVGEFRRQCRAFADHWITVQREEFKRLGVDGDWDNYYSTMKYESEAVIANELGKFLMNGGLYKGSKAVLWSVVEKTALAEAEIEYHDHTSDTVHVRFPVLRSKGGKLDGASVVIWTTTPWTMPGNRALAYGKDIAYVLVEVAAVSEGSKAKVGDRLVLAKDLVGAVAEAVKFTPKVVAELSTDDLEGLVAAHPLRGQGYDFDVRLLEGSFVTADAGTGFVHFAPGHGADDYELGVANGVEVPDTVSEDGSYYPHVPLFAGLHVYTSVGKKGPANKVVTEALDKAG
jgi:isoleucyl-tRNA synthetase